MNNKFTVATFVSVFWFVVPASALTMDDAVSAALANNLDLRAAKFEVEKARGRLIQAGLWPNPEVEVGERTDRAFSDEGEHLTAIDQSLGCAIRASSPPP